MNPLTSLNANHDYLAQYLKYDLSYQKLTTDKSGNQELVELSLQYSKSQVDSVELSADGKKMFAVGESLQILYKSTTTKMQDAAGTEGTENADGADALAAVNEYFNPENTAQRIVDFAASFFSAFSGNHADETDTGKLQNDFTKLMRDAIEQGFQEARAMLGDFYEQDTPGFITDTIGQTYDLVQQKLDALFSDGKEAKGATDVTA